MSKLVNDFKGLPLAQQRETYPLLTATYKAAKEARRVELEAEIEAMGFRPGEAEKPAAAVKYRSKADPSQTWAGRGAEPTWLKAEMQSSGLPLEAFKVTPEASQSTSRTQHTSRLQPPSRALRVFEGHPRLFQWVAVHGVPDAPYQRLFPLLDHAPL